MNGERTPASTQARCSVSDSKDQGTVGSPEATTPHSLELHPPPGATVEDWKPYLISNTVWRLPETPSVRTRRGMAWLVFRLARILERLAWRIEG